jgi:hypothetical protein
MFYTEADSRYEERVKEWNEIEEYVLTYQKQFQENATKEEIKQAKDAGYKIIEKFEPLLRKYYTLLTTGQIDWNDPEMKHFVSNFIDKKDLRYALHRKKQRACYRSEIYSKFNFIIETYGRLSETEIKSDLQTLLLTIAKRYKQMNRNFCSYVYNVYRYEVCRFIKSFIKDPININYKNLEYEDCINGNIDKELEQSYEDNYYEDLTGIPNSDWVLGTNCSEIFSNLTPIDRKILIKYYLEEWKDKQIADHFGMHINTINQRRRTAAKQIATNLGIDLDCIKRTRRSGKKAVLPMQG